MPRNVPAFLGPIAAATLAALLGFSERPPVFEGVPEAERYGSFAVASSGDAALDAVVREELEARGYEARSAADLVRFDGGVFSWVFDASETTPPIPPTANLIAAALPLIRSCFRLRHRFSSRGASRTFLASP